MDSLKRILLHMYPAPVTVDMNSHTQIASYIKTLPRQKISILENFLGEYLKNQNLFIGISIIETGIIDPETLALEKDIADLRNCKLLHFRRSKQL